MTLTETNLDADVLTQPPQSEPAVGLRSLLRPLPSWSIITDPATRTCLAALEPSASRLAYLVCRTHRSRRRYSAMRLASGAFQDVSRHSNDDRAHHEATARFFCAISRGDGDSPRLLTIRRTSDNGPFAGRPCGLARGNIAASQRPPFGICTLSELAWREEE